MLLFSSLAFPQRPKSTSALFTSRPSGLHPARPRPLGFSVPDPLSSTHLSPALSSPPPVSLSCALDSSIATPFIAASLPNAPPISATPKDALGVSVSRATRTSRCSLRSREIKQLPDALMVSERGSHRGAEMRVVRKVMLACSCDRIVVPTTSEGRISCPVPKSFPPTPSLAPDPAPASPAAPARPAMRIRRARRARARSLFSTLSPVRHHIVAVKLFFCVARLVGLLLRSRGVPVQAARPLPRARAARSASRPSRWARNVRFRSSSVRRLRLMAWAKMLHARPGERRPTTPRPCSPRPAGASGTAALTSRRVL